MDKIAGLIPIIRIISRIQKPGKKTLQKLVYLIERKGISSELDYAIHRLEMQGVLKIIPEGMTHQISLTEDDDVFREEIETLSAEELQEIEAIITNFAAKSAFDLEAITTTDYVAQQLKANGGSLDQDSLIEGVRKIKGEKFSQEKIEEAIGILKEERYLVF